MTGLPTHAARNICKLLPSLDVASFVALVAPVPLKSHEKPMKCCFKKTVSKINMFFLQKSHPHLFFKVTPWLKNQLAPPRPGRPAPRRPPGLPTDAAGRQVAPGGRAGGAGLRTSIEGKPKTYVKQWRNPFGNQHKINIHGNKLAWWFFVPQCHLPRMVLNWYFRENVLIETTDGNCEFLVAPVFGPWVVGLWEEGTINQMTGVTPHHCVALDCLLEISSYKVLVILNSNSSMFGEPTFETPWMLTVFQK